MTVKTTVTLRMSEYVALAPFLRHCTVFRNYDEVKVSISSDDLAIAREQLKQAEADDYMANAFILN